MRKKGTVPSNALTAYQAPEREGEVEDLRGMLDLERNRLRALAQVRIGWRDAAARSASGGWACSASAASPAANFAPHSSTDQG